MTNKHVKNTSNDDVLAKLRKIHENMSRKGSVDDLDQPSFKEQMSFEPFRHFSRDDDQRYKETVELHDFRKRYVNRLFWLIIVWLCFVAIVLMLSGFSLDFGWSSKIHFQLSDKVLIAVIVSTSATVLGLFAIAMRWLFPPKDKI